MAYKLTTWEHNVIDHGLRELLERWEAKDAESFGVTHLRELLHNIGRRELRFSRAPDDAAQRRQAAFDAANAKHPLPVSGKN